MPSAKANAKREILPGTLDMLVLKTLTLGALHGYGIAQHIQRLSNDVLRVEEGTIYPALQRMRQRGLISAAWRQTPNNQRARYYTITTAGRRHLGEEEVGFAEIMQAIARVMGHA
jgi:PadR family transcriptional regulator PadR